MRINNQEQYIHDTEARQIFIARKLELLSPKDSEINAERSALFKFEDWYIALVPIFRADRIEW